MLQAANKEKNNSSTKVELLKLKSLQQAAQKLANLKATPESLKTKDLVHMLICQVQRNKRISQPRVRIHLRFASYSTESITVKLRLGASNY